MNELPESELPENTIEEITMSAQPALPIPSQESRRGLWLGIAAVIILLVVAAVFVVSNRQQVEASHWQTTQIAIETGAWETAVSEASQLLNQQPAFLLRHTAEAAGLRGVAHYHLGHHNEALADLNTALEADPNLVDLLAYRAAVHFLQEDESAALADTEIALGYTDLLPAYLRATLLANRADIYAAQGDNELALSTAGAALELADYLPVERLAAVHALQASLYEANGEYEAALESIAAAQSLETSLLPEQAAALALSKTFLLANEEQLRAALAASEEALASEGLADAEKASLHLLRAMALYEQGDVDTAVTEAQLFAALNDTLALPHALLAAQAYGDLEYETAATEATAALELADDFPLSQAIAHRVLAGTLTWQGNAPAALAELDAALEINPEDVAALALRVYNRFSMGDFTGAQADAELIVSIAPETPDALWAAAMSAQSNLDPELALVLMNQAIAQEDGRPEFYLSRAYSYRYTADDPKMLADIQKALELAPGLPDALSAELAYRYDQFEYGDGSDLMTLAEQFIEQYPEWDLGYAMLSQYHLDFSNDLTAAMENINKAIELRPEIARHYTSRGFIHLENNDLEAARTDFEKALELFPEYYGAFSGLSTIAAREDDLATSRTLIEQVVGFAPRGLLARMELASVLLESGELEEVWELTHQVLADDPDYYGALLMRVVLLGQYGQLRPALADIERVLQRYPNHAYALMLKSFMLLQLGEQDEAKEIAQHVLEIDPEVYDAHEILFTIALGEGDTAEAEAQLEQWQTAVPDYAIDHERAGMMQLGLGYLEEGIESLTAALDDDPTDPAALLFNRALAHQQLGDIEAWQADMEEVLQTSANLDLIANTELQLAGNTVSQEDDGRYRLTHEDTGYTLTYGDIWTKTPLEADSGIDLELTHETADGFAVAHVFSFIESGPVTLQEIVAFIDRENANSPIELDMQSAGAITINGIPGHLNVYDFYSPDASGTEVAYTGRQYIFVKDNIVIFIRIEANKDLLPTIEVEIDALANSFEWLE